MKRETAYSEAKSNLEKGEEKRSKGEWIGGGKRGREKGEEGGRVERSKERSKEDGRDGERE